MVAITFISAVFDVVSTSLRSMETILSLETTLVKDTFFGKNILRKQQICRKHMHSDTSMSYFSSEGGQVGLGKDL